MPIINGLDRHQLTFSSLEATIATDNDVRFIDAFVEKLVNETKEFDIESNDSLNSYRDISTAFYSRLVKWIHKNNIK